MCRGGTKTYEGGTIRVVQRVYRGGTGVVQRGTRVYKGVLEGAGDGANVGPLEGAGDGMIVGGNVDGAGVGEAVGAGEGDGLGDCVQPGVLHAACSVVNGHGVPVPSEIVVMVRWRLERPPPPANVGESEDRVRTSDRKAYILRCSCPTQSRRMPRGSSKSTGSPSSTP